MRGQKLIKAVDRELLKEISSDYRRLILKKKDQRRVINPWSG